MSVGKTTKIGRDTFYKDAAPEKLLIVGHAPPWNSQGLGDLKRDEWERFGKFHEFNWGPVCPASPGSVRRAG